MFYVFCFGFFGKVSQAVVRMPEFAKLAECVCVATLVLMPSFHNLIKLKKVLGHFVLKSRSAITCPE